MSVASEVGCFGELTCSARQRGCARGPFEQGLKDLGLVVSRSLLPPRANDPVFVSQRGDRLTRGVHHSKGAAGIDEKVSPHWLRHAHGSHAIEKGASLPLV